MSQVPARWYRLVGRIEEWISLRAYHASDGIITPEEYYVEGEFVRIFVLEEATDYAETRQLAVAIEHTGFESGHVQRLIRARQRRRLARPRIPAFLERLLSTQLITELP